IGDLLTDHDWVAHSGAGTQPIDVTSGLVFDGYLSSGIGGAANLDNTGEDIHRPFAPVTTDSIYAAFIIQTESPNYAGYFFHLGQQTIGTTWLGRVWVNATGDGVAISSGTAPSSYVPITAGTPTLIVVKYVLDTKLSSLYVFNTFPSEEPPTPDATFQETSTFANVGSVALRQYRDVERVIVDGIRVATTWDEAVAAAPSDQVSTPTFDPPAGNYHTPQNVTISCSTEGATIYYTINGDDPTDASTVFADPIAVNSTTTIKAIAYKAGWTTSYVATALYTFPTEVANIAALRANPTGTTLYKLTGEAVLTYKTATRNAKYIQDATGAILIDDNAGNITTAYNLYDGITGIIGSLGEYGDMLQFVPVADPGPATSTGNVVEPVEVTLANLTTDYQAKLVKIKNVVISGTGNFAASTNYTITDVTGTGVIRTQYADLDYIGQPIPAALQNLTGVVLQYQTTMQFVPRGLSDFELATLAQYRSKASGNWTTAGTWQKYDGASWIDADSAPAGFTEHITIQSTDTVTVDDTLRVGSGAVVVVDGYLKNMKSIASSGTFVFNDLSVYEHALDKYAVPEATWNTGSTCLITGITGTSAPTGLDQEFHNFIWNCPNQGGNLNFNAKLTTVNGDFTVLSTNGAQLRLGSVELTVNIAGDVNVEGNSILTSTGSTVDYTITVNVGGDINIAGGSLYLENAGTVVADWNLTGNLIMSDGFLGRRGSGTGNLNFLEGSHVFARTGGTILDNNGGPIFNVKPGAILDLGMSVIEQGPFNLDSSATLICANPGGLDSSLTTPRIITLSPYANYIFNSPSEQVTGTKLPAVVNNLTFENASGDTLTQNVTVNGILTINTGYLEISGDTLTLGPTAILAETNGLVKGDGIITTTRTLSDITSENIAGMGAVLTTAADLGSTVITRGHTAFALDDESSIMRYYDIQPTNNSGLNATLVFEYDESELGDLSETDRLALFSSSDMGALWTDRGGVADTANNQITLSGISAFSMWTIGAHVNLAPSPVTLLMPADGYEITNSDIVQDSLIEVKWTKAIDPEGDAVSYEMFVLFGDEETEVFSAEFTDTSNLVMGPSPEDNGNYKMYVVAYDSYGASSCSDTVSYTVNITPDGIKGELVPMVFALHQNYPNPFNPTTTIKYDLPKDVHVKIVIYDIMGREVRTLVNARQQAGYKSIQWNATNNHGMQVSSGYYIYIMQAGEFHKNQKMILMK
ncbi:MAG: chitobiase/beta-hexosaminidase C-terminal domain-containing protein, partial [Candidatus Marinimicrobia bacterium]|nr:chitobiase/beta-hexosaminidase C-terminal domain-containing protein [Candidatus Neomarinimicrobiota bacterium]